MNEGMPQKEGSPVPDYVFDKAWQEGNFQIPADKELRIEKRQQLESFSNYGIMWMDKNRKVRDILLARIAAIDAYDSHLDKSKK